MIDRPERRVWGLWNSILREWFNAGRRRPYFETREQAERLLPVALRQYGVGKWEVREYPASLT